MVGGDQRISTEPFGRRLVRTSCGAGTGVRASSAAAGPWSAQRVSAWLSRRARSSGAAAEAAATSRSASATASAASRPRASSPTS
ncbi:Uncharacterised protein [Mycobacteroides abscessus subsp. abscessus]|nr:Uncharacterised protein [Mycobacteroides abscessus subsp. abscessus]